MALLGDAPLLSFTQKCIIDGTLMPPLPVVLSALFLPLLLSSMPMRFKTPSHSSIVLSDVLQPLPALIEDAPLLSSIEKNNVGGNPLPSPPGVFSVPLSPFHESAITICYIHLKTLFLFCF